MKITHLAKLSQHDIEKLLSRISLLKELHSLSPDQLSKILKHSCLVELDSGEVIMRRGDKGTSVYFLVKGHLSVYLDEVTGEPLNTINPGELFGDLALLSDNLRKATVTANQNNKGVQVFVLDIKPFGELEDFSEFSLETKLIFYRRLANSIRWRIEQRRVSDRDNPLAKELAQIKVYTGSKNTIEELRAVNSQAREIALLLDQWNKEVER